ncbi:MAG: ABC transporter permease [Verrucomicrobia bacterium]|nr:ABC transporter permease [Verrucomicrobiota bacterium]
MTAIADPHITSAGKRQPGTTGWLLLSPMLLWLGLFVVAPTAILFVYSFCQRDELGQVVFEFTWENYARIADPVYLNILLRSIWYAGLTTAICLVVGYPVAYYIGRAPAQRRSWLLLLVMIPFWISFLLRTYAWISLLKAEGPVSALLQWAHLIATPLEILYTPTAVMIGLVYTYLPFMILPIFTSAEKLDNSLIEASLDLGAGPWRTLSNIIIPLTKPGIFAGVLLVFVPSIGMFAVTDLMGGARVPMIGNVIQNQFGQARDWPFGAALGITFLVLFVIAFWFLHERGEERR